MPPPQLQSIPQEDLSVVLGRFHSWDADRKKSAADVHGQGVRELSYEEALAYSHPRRPARSTLPPMPASNAATAQSGSALAMAVNVPVESATLTTNANPVQRASVAPEKKAGKSSPRVARKPDLNSESKGALHAVSKGVHLRAARVRKPVRRRDPQQVAMPESKAALKSKPKKATTKLPGMTTSPATRTAPDGIIAKPSSKAARTARKPAGSSVTTEARQSATFHGALAACLKEAPRRRAPQKNTTKSKPAKAAEQQTSLHRNAQKGRKIQRAKKSVAAPVAQAIPRKPVESIARNISINLRLSKPEHDRMRRGAAEADLSLATFIRESTLRFQIGREREKQKMLESGDPAIADDVLNDLDEDFFDRPILEPAGPSLLTRMKNFWMGRRLTAIA